MSLNFIHRKKERGREGGRKSTRKESTKRKRKFSPLLVRSIKIVYDVIGMSALFFETYLSELHKVHFLLLILNFRRYSINAVRTESVVSLPY